MDDAIEKRQGKNMEILLSELRKTPIVQIACSKSRVGRATYYRWRKESPEFADLSDQALIEGSLLVNDVAESQLMSAIKDKNMTAIIFWLKYHHPTYKQSINIDHVIKNGLTESEIVNLVELLFDQDTFKEGQKLLTTYIFRGKIGEAYASLVLRMIVSQTRTQDIFTRQDENHILNEVMFRKNRRVKKQHG